METGLNIFFIIVFIIILTFYNVRISKMIWLFPLVISFKIMTFFERQYGRNSFYYKILRLSYIGVHITISGIIISVVVLFILIFLYILQLILFVIGKYSIDFLPEVIDYISKIPQENILLSEFPVHLVLFSFFLFFGIEYKIYKKVLTILDKKNWSILNLDEKEQIEINKYALSDFTIIIVFLGFFPFMIDNTFSEFQLSMKIKYTIFIVFSCVLAPYVNLIYKSLK